MALRSHARAHVHSCTYTDVPLRKHLAGCTVQLNVISAFTQVFLQFCFHTSTFRVLLSHNHFWRSAFIQALLAFCFHMSAFRVLLSQPNVSPTFIQVLLKFCFHTSTSGFLLSHKHFQSSAFTQALLKFYFYTSTSNFCFHTSRTFIQLDKFTSSFNGLHLSITHKFTSP